ncbi:hypothetical protein GCM10007908_37250 [Rhizobium albus]|nr:hypothetical protein GCM10007908_37250 [Rhizobium albus]
MKSGDRCGSQGAGPSRKHRRKGNEDCPTVDDDAFRQHDGARHRQMNACPKQKAENEVPGHPGACASQHRAICQHHKGNQSGIVEKRERNDAEIDLKQRGTP